MNKYMILKLFNRDMTYSFSYGKYKYLLFYALIIVLTVAESLKIKSFTGNSVDAYFQLLKDTGYFYQLSDYVVPVNWLFIQLIVLFLVSDFLVHDFKVNSHYLLLRIHVKGEFILSKLWWIITQNTLIHFGIIIIIYVISSCILGDFSLEVSSFYHLYIDSQMIIPLSPLQLFLHIFLGYVMTSIVLSSLFLLCLQLFTPIISFCLAIIISSLSTFLDWKWLPAIHSMILKKDVFDYEHHLSIQFSAAYSVCVFILLSVITYFLFKKKDII